MEGEHIPERLLRGSDISARLRWKSSEDIGDIVSIKTVQRDSTGKGKEMGECILHFEGKASGDIVGNETLEGRVARI